MSYFFDFSWLYNFAFPKLGELFGYFIAFGEVDTVVIDYLLKGNTFTWEVANIFTGTSFIISVPSYGAVFEALVSILPANDILIRLVGLFEGFFSHFGHVIYKLIFELPISVPLWLGLVCAVPRFVVLNSIFKFFKNVVIETVT